MKELLATSATGAAAAAIVLLFDFRCRARGLDLPGFRSPARRALVLVCLATVLWWVIFLPLRFAGQEVDPTELSPLDLFGSQFLMALGLMAFLAGGFAGSGRTAWEWGGYLGWSARRPLWELAVGVGAGLSIWATVLAAQLLLAMAVEAVGGKSWLPDEPSQLLVWIVSLPAGWKIALAVTAGLVEETFFRGLLQPQLGWLLAAVLFSLAHAGYGEPILFGGLLVFSGFVSWLVVWRQSIWAAVVAHALFDLLQLFLVIPAVLYWYSPLP